MFKLTTKQGPHDAGADALGDTIGGMFDIPEVDLDNQMADLASTGENTSTEIQPTATENSNTATDLGDLF